MTKTEVTLLCLFTGAFCVVCVWLTPSVSSPSLPLILRSTKRKTSPWLIREMASYLATTFRICTNDFRILRIFFHLEKIAANFSPASRFLWRLECGVALGGGYLVATNTGELILSTRATSS
jgi:hypothetical protein